MRVAHEGSHAIAGFPPPAQEMGRRALHHTDVIMGYREWFASV